MKLSRRALWVAGGLVAGLVAGASFLAFAQRGPGWGRALRAEEGLTPAQVTQIVTEFLAGSGLEAPDEPKLIVDHVMNFETGYYVALTEKDTGRGAMELIVDPYSGLIRPEPGPNMMWNERYSPMGGWASWRAGRRSSRSSWPGGPWGGGCHGPGVPGGYWPSSDSAVTRLTEAEAAARAQRFLDAEFPGTKVAEPIHFYGYYTFDIVKDGEVQGMLSVHDLSGEVWYHAWHGRSLGEDSLQDKPV